MSDLLPALKNCIIEPDSLYLVDTQAFTEETKIGSWTNMGGWLRYTGRELLIAMEKCSDRLHNSKIYKAEYVGLYKVIRQPTFEPATNEEKETK